MSTSTVDNSVTASELESQVVKSAPVDNRRLVTKIEDEGPIVVALVTLTNTAAANLNTVHTANSAVTATVEDIAKDLAATSTDHDIVKWREQLDMLQERITAKVYEAAKAAKADAGEPDVKTEAKAATDYKEAKSVLDKNTKGLNLDHFLTEVTSTRTRRKLGDGSTKPASTGPKNDVQVVREWGLANGFSPGDRGRLKREITDAYIAAVGPVPILEG